MGFRPRRGRGAFNEIASDGEECMIGHTVEERPGPMRESKMVHAQEPAGRMAEVSEHPKLPGERGRMAPMPLARFVLFLVFVTLIFAIGTFIINGSLGSTLFWALVAAVILQVAYFALILLQVVRGSERPAPTADKPGRSDAPDPLYPLAKRHPKS